MTAFTDIFGGDTLFPSDLSYRAVALSASTTLQWPTEASAGTNLVAAIMDVTASAGSLSLTMPPATEVSTGTSVIFNNVGGTTFTVLDNGGNTLLTVASGLIWTLYLTDNSTANGSWKTYQNGAGTSSASAASLAGYGLKAITTTLNQTMPVTSTAVNFTADATYRAGVWVWTGGAGVVSLTAPATLGDDWFFNIKNSGTGDIVLTPLAGSIDGETTVTLSPDESAIVVTDGVNFFTIGLTPIPTPGFDYTAIAVPGSGNYTLAGTEVGRISYSFTGALTGVRTIVIPASVQQYWVSNDTTGSTTGFFVKTSSQAGSGISIPPGMSRLLRCDGNNAIDAASNPIKPQLPTGTGTNTVVITVPTAPSQYVDGFALDYIAQSANTSAVTVNVNGLGAVALRYNGAALTSSNIISGQVVRSLYSATIPSFEMASINVPEPTAWLLYKVSNSTNVTGTGGVATVQFDSSIFNVNSAASTSGVITFPKTGKYRCSVNIMSTNYTSAATQATAFISSSNRLYVARNAPLPSLAASENTIQINTLIDADAGDVATIVFQVAGMATPAVTIEGGGSASTLLTYFSGEFVQ